MLHPDWETGLLVDEQKEATGIREEIRKHTLFILGVRVDNLDLATALEGVQAFLSEKGVHPPSRVFFTNVHTIHLARSFPEFQECVNSAEMVLADGSGVRFAGRVLGVPIRENLNGTDLAPRLFRLA